MKVYETHSSLVIFILITVVSGSSFIAPPPVFAAERGLYVPNYGSDTVSIIKTNTNTVSSPIIVGNGPLAIAFDPPHNRMYVANFYSDTISVIDTNTNTVVGLPLVTGAFPIGFAFAPPQP